LPDKFSSMHGERFFVVSCWLLVVGYWLWVMGYRSLVVACCFWLPVGRCRHS